MEILNCDEYTNFSVIDYKGTRYWRPKDGVCHETKYEPFYWKKLKEVLTFQKKHETKWKQEE